MKTNKINIIKYLAVVTFNFVKNPSNFLLFFKHNIVYHFYIVLKSLQNYMFFKFLADTLITPKTYVLVSKN